jgi:hypothetical protein
MAVKAAQEVDGVGDVAARMRAGSFEKRLEMRMAGGPHAGDAGELGRGNADRFRLN